MKESKVNKENYVVIQGWMLTDLQLKGNELLVYACIYGFTQHSNQVFSGSWQYLADWTNSTKRGVSNCLKALVEKGYLEKEDKIINGVKFCEYRATNCTRVVNKIHGGSEESSSPPSEESSPNNIEVNNIEKKKEYKGFVKPSLDEVKAYCKERNNNVDPQKFFDYFSASNWIDSKGNPVRNWKQKIITWESGGCNGNNGKHKSVDFEPYPSEY